MKILLTLDCLTPSGAQRNANLCSLKYLFVDIFTYTKLGLSGDIHFRSRTLGYSRTDDLVQDVLFLFFH